MTKENVNTPTMPLTMPLGKHTGRAALADCAKTLGYELDAELLTRVFEEFKKRVDWRTYVYVGDLVQLIEQQIHESHELTAKSIPG
jgi:2-isopropylmalate synthase